jgi:hypothetical protein
MSKHLSLYSLSRAVCIEEKKLPKVIKGLKEGVADTYFVFEKGEIRYREDRKDALNEFLQEEFTSLSKTSTIRSLSDFKSTISGRFAWDRQSPLPAGKEFYCSPFELLLEVSEFAPEGIMRTLKLQNWTEQRDTFGFRNFSITARSTAEIFDFLDSFMTKYLYQNSVNTQAPKKHKLIISPPFFEELMHFKQSVTRYKLRPSEEAK